MAQIDSLASSKKSLPFRKRYLAGDQEHATNDSSAPQDQIVVSESSATFVDRTTSAFGEPLIRKVRLDNLEREPSALDRSSEESSADDEDDDFQMEGNKRRGRVSYHE